jgi:hypothetical protein
MGGTFNPLNSVINPQQQQQIAALVQASQGNSGAMAQAPPDQMPMPGSAQQGAQGVLPPQSPVGGPGDVNNVLAINRGLSESPGIAGPNAALDAQRQKIADLESQRAAMQVPQTAPHNLLLRILSATAPGHAINNAVYGPGVNQYNTQRQNIADQLESLKSQSGISGEQLKSGTGIADTSGKVLYRGAEIGVQQERNTIAKQRSDTQATNVARQSANDLVRQSQGWQRLSQDQQKVALQQWFQKAEIDVAQQRVNAGMDENSARIQSAQDVRAEVAQNQYVLKNPILSKIMGGLGLAPDISATPAAQNPVVQPKPQPAGSSKSKPAAKKGDPLGIL